MRAPSVPRHSWLGCAMWVCVLAVRFWLHPASPGWGVGLRVLVCALSLYPATHGRGVRCGCVCLGSSFGCAPPFLAGVSASGFRCFCSASTPCGVGVCAWARVSAAPRHSWLGCWGVCLFFSCALRLYPTNPGCAVCCCCVCLGCDLGCALPVLARVLSCVFWCVRSACTVPVLAAVCGVGVCAWARVSAPPRQWWPECWAVFFGVCAPPVPCQSWLGCAVLVCVLRFGVWLPPPSPGWGVRLCVLVFLLRLYPSNPGWGVRFGCVCLGSGFCCAHPVLLRVLGCVFWCVRFPCTPPTPRWGVRCGCVYWGSVFSCAPPFLAGVLRCECLCAPFACTPPFLAQFVMCGLAVASHLSCVVVR